MCIRDSDMRRRMSRLCRQQDVCPPVRPSVTLVNYNHKMQYTADILIPHERAITLLFWHQQWLAGDGSFGLKFVLKVTHPFEKRRLWQISAYNVSTVRDSEKVQWWRIGTWSLAFQRAIDRKRTLPPKSPNGWFKKRFCVFLIKCNFNRIKSATKLLCMKTFSSKVVV